MSTTLEYFEFQAPRYDAFQQSCVPKYSEALKVVATFLERALRDGRAPRIVDLGCGTGNTIASVAEALPEASFIGIDGSARMIEEARRKLASRPVEFHRADLATSQWDSPWADSVFDAAVSVMVLEHLPFPVYRELLKKVRRFLKPGAWFVTVEGFDGPFLFDLYFKEMDECSREAVARGILAEDELDEFHRLSEEKEAHYFAPMNDKMQWLTDAGFEDVQSIWQYYCVGILAGRASM